MLQHALTFDDEQDIVTQVHNPGDEEMFKKIKELKGRTLANVKLIACIDDPEVDYDVVMLMYMISNQLLLKVSKKERTKEKKLRSTEFF